MKPVAQALNILQSEKNMYLAYLLPTIGLLRDKLVAQRMSATVCKPLISALITGIDNRFASSLDDLEAISAAILHPKFKTNWTTNQEIIEKGLRHIRGMLDNMEQQTEVASSGAEDVDDDEELFFKVKKSDHSARAVLDQYLHSTSEDTATIGIAAWPKLKPLFVRLNAALPASAAVERLFSCAGLIMSHKRTRLSDKHFENLLFCKMNKWVSE